MRRKLATMPIHRTTPENKLWAAVILQAWDDYFDPTCIGAGDDVDTAEAFLFSRRKTWKAWRDHVCELAGGFEGDTLREAAIKERRRLGR